MDSLIYVTGIIVLGGIAICLACMLAIFLFALFCRINSSTKMASYRIKKRYKILQRLDKNLVIVDSDMTDLMRKSFRIDQMMYAYLNDKEAYEVLRAQEERRAKATQIDEDILKIEESHSNEQQGK